jgi:hypothetical protein
MRASVNGGEGSGFGRHHIRRIAGPATLQFPAALDLASMLRPAAARGVDRRGVSLFPAVCGFPRSIPSESLQRTSRLDRIACGRRAFHSVPKVSDEVGRYGSNLHPTSVAVSILRHARNLHDEANPCPRRTIPEQFGESV